MASIGTTPIRSGPVERGGSETHRFELLVCCLLIFVLSGAALALSVQGNSSFDINSVTGDSRISQLLLLVLYGSLLPYMYRCRHAIANRAFSCGSLLAVLALVAVSPLWSPDPATTFRKAAGLWLTYLFGLYLASRYDTTQLLKMVSRVLAVALILSLALIITFPDWGDSPLGWRGIYLSKNQLGRAASLEALILVLLWPRSGRYRKWLALGLLLSWICVVGANSASALVVTILVCGLGTALWRFRRLPGGVILSAAALLACGLTVAWAVKLSLDPLLGAVGKDSTLTGRTELWSGVLRGVEKRPFLGYGIDGFWQGFNEPSRAIWETIAWHPTHAHNGLLDLLLDLGVVGVCLTLTLLWRGASVGTAGLRAGWLGARWNVMFVVFMLASSISESVFYKPNTLYMVLLTVVATQCRPLVAEKDDS